MIRLSLFHLVVSSVVLLVPWNSSLHAQANPDWHRPFPAFKIAGNLYYVGTADLAVYLINTPQGNILINSDFKEDVPLIPEEYRATRVQICRYQDYPYQPRACRP